MDLQATVTMGIAAETVFNMSADHCHCISHKAIFVLRTPAAGGCQVSEWTHPAPCPIKYICKKIHEMKNPYSQLQGSVCFRKHAGVIIIIIISSAAASDTYVLVYCFTYR